MPGLILQPDIHDIPIEEYEAHLEVVRARRMSAALTYIEGKNAKLLHATEKIERQMRGQYEMLGREIERLDAAIEKAEARVQKIITYKQEMGLILDQVDTSAGAEADPDEED